MNRRLEFGLDPAPVDPTLCVARVLGRDGKVLTQDLCLHGRRDHGRKGAGCTRCACRGFVQQERRP